MMHKAVFLSAFLLASLPTAHALPLLQLDVSGGVYDPSSQSTVTTSNVFNLYALINSTSVTGTYYVSAAVLPKQSNVPADLGSFTFAGEPVDVTDDMTWGTPDGLGPHGTYPTWYREFNFSFDPSQTMMNYNVQDVVGVHTGPSYHSSGNGLYVAFSVDVSGMAAGTTIVFDLYGYDVTYQKNNRSSKQVEFVKAPYSHNAEGSPSVPVPDGANTLVLLALGLLGTAGFRWSRSR